MIATDDFYYSLLSKISQMINGIHKRNHLLVYRRPRIGQFGPIFYYQIFRDLIIKLGTKMGPRGFEPRIFAV